MKDRAQKKQTKRGGGWGEDQEDEETMLGTDGNWKTKTNKRGYCGDKIVIGHFKETNRNKEELKTVI